MLQKLTLLASLAACGLVLSTARADSLRPNISLDDWIATAIRFIEWPSARADSNPAVTLCFPTGQLSSSKLDGRVVRGLRITMNPVGTEQETGPCTAFFTNGDDPNANARWLRSLQGRPVLTIGVAQDFCAKGGLVCTSSARFPSLHYAVNFARAAQAGFRVRSHLPAHDFSAPRVALAALNHVQ
jgi:hypothetical protein